jgi:hypothetical protein
MCFATAAAVAGIAGSALTAGGTLEGGQAAKNSASYAAQVAANNAATATANASYSERAGQAQATATSLKGAATMGKIKTAQAASGVDVNTGSAAGVQQSEREVSMLDTETTQANADLQAYGYRTQATGYAAQGQLEQAEAEQAPIGADLAAAGGILSSASSVGAKWWTPPVPSAAPQNYS